MEKKEQREEEGICKIKGKINCVLDTGHLMNMFFIHCSVNAVYLIPEIQLSKIHFLGPVTISNSPQKHSEFPSNPVSTCTQVPHLAMKLALCSLQTSC